MAHGLAALRPAAAPIFAFTPHVQLLRQLRILRAVEPFQLRFDSDPNVTIENAISVLRHAGRISSGDKLIVATDILAQDRLIDAVQLRTVR